MARVNGSRNRDDVVGYNLANLDGVALDLGDGYDVVKFGFKNSGASKAVLTFDGASVGDGSSGEDGLAVMVQGENADTEFVGPVGRFDDEGISFLTDNNFGFEIRDGSTGLDFGRLYQVARLGTSGNDLYDEAGSTLATYINGGKGNDQITGGIGNDHLIGGAGADRLDGAAGNDILVGGLGRDTITGGAGDDLVIARPFRDGADIVDLGDGSDRVILQVAAKDGDFVGLRIDHNLVGNGDAYHDGVLSIELFKPFMDSSNSAPMGRYDDEGISFSVSGNARIVVADNDQQYNVDEVHLGTTGDDTLSATNPGFFSYLAGGDGDDLIIGSEQLSYIFGGNGNDQVELRSGAYFVTGGAGDDTVFFSTVPGFAIIDGFESGHDVLDLSAFDISFSAVNIQDGGAYANISIDTNGDGNSDFSLNTYGDLPVESDFVF